MNGPIPKEAWRILKLYRTGRPDIVGKYSVVIFYAKEMWSEWDIRTLHGIIENYLLPWCRENLGPDPDYTRYCNHAAIGVQFTQESDAVLFYLTFA